MHAICGILGLFHLNASTTGILTIEHTYMYEFEVKKCNFYCKYYYRKHLNTKYYLCICTIHT